MSKENPKENSKENLRKFNEPFEVVIENKNKQISNSFNGKGAIFFLCMLKSHYVIAACITAFTHRYLIRQTNKNIKLVIMCDHEIYRNWRDVLSEYFDEVKK
jgi:hypothetical protein